MCYDQFLRKLKILNGFMVANWQEKKELNNRFGLVLVKSLKSSAETKASSKPLGSAEIETETEGSVVH